MLFATNRRKAQEKNFKRLRASCSGGLPVAPQRAKADDRRSSSLEWGRAVTFLPPVTAAATTLPVKAHRFGSTSGENGPPLTARGDCQVAHLIPLTRFRASPFLIGKMPMPRLFDLHLRAGRHSRVWRGNDAPKPGNHQSSSRPAAKRDIRFPSASKIWIVALKVKRLAVSSCFVYCWARLMGFGADGTRQTR